MIDIHVYNYTNSIYIYKLVHDVCPVQNWEAKQNALNEIMRQYVLQ